MKSITIALLCTFLSVNLLAQKNLGPFTINKITQSSSLFVESISDLNPNFFFDQLANEENYLLEVQSNNQILSGGEGNVLLRFGIELDVPSHERFSISTNVLWIPVKRTSMQFLDFQSNNPTISYLDFELRNHEVGLESIVAYNIVNREKIKVFAGIGSNAGISVNDRIIVEGTNIHLIESIELNEGAEGDVNLTSFTKSNLYHRVFLHAGFSAMIREGLELGFEYSSGKGTLRQKESTNQKLKFITLGLCFKYTV